MSFTDLFQLPFENHEGELDNRIPACWPNRPGDAEPYDIFLNVGRTLTRWERVEVSLLETVRAMQSRLEDSNKVARHYSRRREALQKLNMVAEEFERNARFQGHLAPLRCQYIEALHEYLIWKTGRNRIAHGVVIVSGPILMDEVENGMVPTYQLHPSEGDQRNWLIPWESIDTPNGTVFREGDSDDCYINDGPVFSYRASDILEIGNEIARLDQRLQDLTQLFIGPKTGFDGLGSHVEDDLVDLSR